MSSTNEELPPKPRVSPLDFRNTDLVSRLLAATPPYLYNMPLVPNSYFFSEMLRSLVQAKSEASNRTSLSMHHRRSRKRSWTQAKSDCYKASSKPEQTMNWSSKFQDKNMEVPLELTTNKLPTLSENLSPAEETKVTIKPNLESSKHEIPPNSSIPPMLYPNPAPSNTQQNGNLIMPPPPVWYPSLYPSPYGIDPLHFFIDLRVSSHIYDRKNQKDIPSVSSPQIPSRSQITPDMSSEQEQLQESLSNFHGLTAPNNNFKQTRHASAFTVPIPSIMKNSPMNLSSDKPAERTETRTTKFDVKSLGFDKSYSKTSTNYIMTNVGNIYKALAEQSCPLRDESQEIQVDELLTENAKDAEDKKTEHEDTEEQKRKKVEDLRALIGLELVVDYMNHAKPRQPQENYDDSSADADSTASSAVEVVSVEESSPDVLTY